MNTKLKFFMRLVLILLAVGSVGAVVMRQNEIAGLRAEQQTLLNDSQEAERLAHENAGIEKLRHENEEVAKLRLENKDLPKLRNEVRQLRKLLEEMAKLRAENERLSARSAKSPNEAGGNVFEMVFSKESLRDVGLGMPILTLQTFFAALSQGNVDRAMECLTPESAAEVQAAAKAGGRSMLLDLMNGFTGYQITDRSQPLPDEIILQVKLTGTGATQAVRFKRVGNEWKMNP